MLSEILAAFVLFLLVGMVFIANDAAKEGSPMGFVKIGDLDCRITFGVHLVECQSASYWEDWDRDEGSADPN